MMEIPLEHFKCARGIFCVCSLDISFENCYSEYKQDFKYILKILTF